MRSKAPLVLLLLACGPERSVISKKGGHAGEPATGGSEVGGTSGANGGATGGVGTGGTGLDAGAAGDDGGGGSTGGDAGAATGGKAGSIGMGGGNAGVGGRGGAAGAGGSSGGGAAGTSGGGMGGATPLANEWATWPMPNPASTGLPNPHRYTDLGDGTVRDEVTGLVWQKNIGAGLYDWQGAKAACRFPEGSRLPSIIELVSLVDTTRQNAALDPIFPVLPGMTFWSASGLSGDPSRAWVLQSAEGITLQNVTSVRCPVRCVREGAESSLPHYEAVTVGATQAVRDNWTGLVWQQPIAASTFTFAEAASHCQALGEEWRAPSMKELQTLVDRRRTDPSIDAAHFPDTPSGLFRTSTTPPNSTVAWSVSFTDGYTNTYLPADPQRVRCVR